MEKTLIIYDKTCSWEKDFLLNDLLIGIDTEIITVSPKKLISADFYKNISGKNILVFSSNANCYADIKKVVLYIKPLVIIHTSDEWGRTPSFLKLERYTKLYLRQHNCWQYKNIKSYQIPLGYMSGIFDNGSLFVNSKPLQDRKYVWSFIGNMKQDRAEMLTVFESKFPNYFCDNGISPKDMYDIYRDSIFVVNGRGNVSLDCFRLYEAIIAGAIPVLVGDKAEIDHVFYFNGDKPEYWIIADNWEEAAVKCKDLLMDSDLLIKYMQGNIKWFKKKVINIQTIIKAVNL